MDLELVFVTFQILVATCIGRPGFNLELIFATFQKATLGSGGGHPSTRSVLQGRLHNRPTGGAWVRMHTP